MTEKLGLSERPEADDDMPRWLTVDPETWRGGGVMSRRRTSVGAENEPTPEPPLRGRSGV